MNSEHPYARGRSSALARIESDGLESARAWLHARIADKSKPALDSRYIRGYEKTLEEWSK